MAGKWRRIIAGLAAALIMAGCAHIMAYNAALDAEKSGDYVRAADKTVEAIEHARDYPEARSIWPRIWPTASTNALTRIAEAERANDWTAAVADLEALNRLQQRALALGLEAPLEPLAPRLANARDRAADKLYHDGLACEQRGALREAAIAFRQCLDYVKDYRDAEARYAKTRSAAMVRVAVLPFDNTSYYRSAGDLLGDKLIQDLLGKQGEFLSFVDRQYLNTVIKEASLQASGLVDPTTAVRLGKLAGVRYLVVGRVLQVSATTPTDSREQYTASRLITDQNMQYNVTATYTLWRQVREVLLTASVQIIDVTDGTVTKAWSETERSADMAESISNLVGDTRALDTTQQRQYYTAPNLKSHDTLVNEATTTLSRRLAARIAETLN
jgi:tetratricopeptide (TPR) repeat protein